MKKYIRDTLITLLETSFLLFSFMFFIKYTFFDSWDFLFRLPNELGVSITFPAFFAVLYLLLLIFILIFKRQLLKFKRWRILHFSLRRIDNMSGQDFEEYLQYQFEQLGFQVFPTKISNDYGADLILQKKNLTIAVQAKRYQGNIGVKAVQEVIGSMAYYHAQKGLVVTNSTYTRNAGELALANDVILWDRDVLIRLMGNENMAGYLAELMEDNPTH